FPVQYVIRPQTEDLHDYRGYAGKIISGIYKTGEVVTVLPSGLTSRIKAIEIDGGRRVPEAFAPQSIVLHLEDDLDVSRGDVIVLSRDLPKNEKDLEAMVCWMDNKPLRAGNKYFLQMNSSRVRVIVKDLNYRMDVNSMEKIEQPEKAELNDIVSVSIRASQPVIYDSFNELRVNGGGILIDETSNVTVGACMIR
ncbi:MAG: sulfate adenylyltransferase, partial [Chitinophagaceae bacterium]|nr:sulfate adenylyltransferase [Chitinophagaceae bacterium]